jgi:hypothetical protein
MNKDFEKASRIHQSRLQAALLKATADFLEAEGGMRFKDIIAVYNAAIQALQVTKIAQTPHPSYDLLNDGQ